MHKAPNAIPYALVGDIYMKMNQTQTAFVPYKQALQYDEEDVLAYYGIGQALMKLGKTREAQLAFQRAKQLGYEDESTT
jgi:cytochrome c-type biogenesis protein CcmH/NrfG